MKVLALIYVLCDSRAGGRGPVVYDLGYGGAFYALVSVQQFNVDLKTTPIQELLHLANDIFHGVKNITTLTHPDSADLAFLYGVILTDGCDTADVSNNICFFGEAEEVVLLLHMSVRRTATLMHYNGQAPAICMPLASLYKIYQSGWSFIQRPQLLVVFSNPPLHTHTVTGGSLTMRLRNNCTTSCTVSQGPSETRYLQPVDDIILDR